MRSHLKADISTHPEIDIQFDEPDTKSSNPRPCSDYGVTGFVGVAIASNSFSRDSSTGGRSACKGDEKINESVTMGCFSMDSSPGALPKHFSQT